MDPRCPRRLKTLPKAPCGFGKRSIDSIRKNRKDGHLGCQFFIADPESNYCFFKFMADDGRPVPTHRIAHLLMMDDNEVKKIVQNFRKSIPDLFNGEITEEDLFF
jgi:hypothetical protein